MFVCICVCACVCVCVFACEGIIIILAILCCIIFFMADDMILDSVLDLMNGARIEGRMIDVSLDK